MMNKRKNRAKVTPATKMAMGALSVLGVIGGWNIIGRVESAASAGDGAVEEAPQPTPTTVAPRPAPWPTIQPLAEMPRLAIKPVPTLASGAFFEAQADAAVQEGQDGTASFALSAAPSVAPLPTLAPLPALPEYVPPPPPPPAPSSGGGGGGGGGGNRSQGS